jgi:hypothetical protein
VACCAGADIRGPLSYQQTMQQHHIVHAPLGHLASAASHGRPLRPHITYFSVRLLLLDLHHNCCACSCMNQHLHCTLAEQCPMQIAPSRAARCPPLESAAACWLCCQLQAAAAHAAEPHNQGTLITIRCAPPIIGWPIICSQ